MAIDPKTGKYIPEGLDSLLPEYQAQYRALEPEIERTVREASNARGVFYSGDAIAEEARAKEALLASLANASASARQSSQESEKDRAARSEENKQSTKAALMGPALGAGLGALGTLAGIKLMQGGSQTVPVVVRAADGSETIKMVNTKSGQISEVGAPAAKPAAPVTSASGPSAWTGKGMASGAAGGLAGSELARALGLGGKFGTEGAALGGLGGFAAMSKYSTNPYMLAAGAGLGAFGGRGLSGLIG